MGSFHFEVVEGNLFDQPVEAIVNPYNRGLIPWWLQYSAGVMGQLKKLAGKEPSKELTSAGVLNVGQAVLTNGGKWVYQVIHTATLNHWWRASQESV